MNKYYIILLLAFLLKSFAGIPIFLRMYKTQDTNAFPYIFFNNDTYICTIIIIYRRS